MSDTPQTDKRKEKGIEWVPINAMALFERENTALRAHAERMAEALEELTDDKASLPGKPRWKAYDNARQALTLYRAENPKV